MFMKKILLCLLMFSTYASGQKSAPVSGDAAGLIDLLFKDYSNVSTENMLEEIAKDRAKVIAVFKTYTDGVAAKATYSQFETERSDYLKSKDDYDLQVKKNDLTVAGVQALISLKSSFTSKKATYFGNLYTFNDKELENLKDYFAANNNAFLVEVIEKFRTKYKNIKESNSDNLAVNNSQLSVQKGFPFAGGDILVKGIDGLSRFLANRIKQELTLNAIQNIQEYLQNKEKYPYLYELEVLLPTTFDYLKNFDADEILKFTDDLKQYIEQDLKNLVSNAKNLREVPRIVAQLQKHPDLDFAFEGLDILQEVSKIKSPVDYFEIVSASRNINRWRGESGMKKDIAEGLNVACMIAYSLTVVENGEVKFITTDFASAYGSQKDFCYLYFGFLHQQNLKYYQVKNGVNLVTGFVSDADKLGSYHDFLKYEVIDIISGAERLQSQFLAIRKKNKNAEKVEYREMHTLIKDVIRFAQEITYSGDWILEKLNTGNYYSAKLKPYFETAYLANDITLDLNEKRYTNAITKAVEIPLMLGMEKGIENNLGGQLKFSPRTIQELAPISGLFKVKDESAVKQKEAWKQYKTQTEILQFKMMGDTKLSPIAKDLEKLNGLSVDSWDENLFKVSLSSLKTDINNNKDAMMAFLGYDRKSEKEVIEKKLENYKLQPETKKFILKKYDAYYDQVFDKVVFNEKFSLDAEEELKQVYSAFLPELAAQKSIKSNTQLVKFIHFVNDVAVADSPEDYEKAIEAFALPVGSSSLKEKAVYYFSINSFPGILVGGEKTQDKELAGFIGFTAPVGLYLQPWGAFKNRGSLGIFLPIIDIAAPVRLRLDGSKDTQTLPDFELQDIISPGFYLVYGFPNSPFAVNAGIQYGPKLRDIPESTDGGFTSADSYRFGAGVTIDIPLLTIGSKYKNLEP